MIKILAIDDNRDNLISLKALLTDALPQSVVYMELTGQGGIGSARENDPDVILLDIVMPGMDGYQVCKILKADEQLSETPVIFLTALKGDKQSRILALEAGGEAFLSKPIDSTELKAQILAMLKIKEAHTYKRDQKFHLEELVQKRTEELKGANIAALNLLEDLNAEIEIRKQSEEALSMNKELLSETESIGKVGGWSFNIDTMEQKWTDEVYRIHEVEISPGPSVDAGINYYTKESRPIIEKAVQRAIELGENYDLELEIITAKGNTRAVHTIGKADLKNRRIHGFFQDITQRKQAEEKLKLLNRAVEASSVAVEITDAQGNIIYVNSYFSELTGYSYEEVLGKNPRFLKSGYHPKTFYEELWNTILSGREWTGEFQNRKKNGDLYWEKAIISPILNSNGKVASFVAIKEDITERKKILEELVEAKEKAEESDRLKTAFLANMSHEIRTPMNGILGFAGLLKDPKLSGEVQQKYIQIIEKSGARMLNIINDIVSISKIESGIIDIHLSEMNINTQLQYVYDILKLDADNKNLKLSFNCGFTDKEATIKTDGEKFYGILSNLVKNAIKYTDSGTIEFGYNIVETHGGASPGSASLQFYVKDTGIGIPKDRQIAIFERFIQADITDKMARQGAGLGLTISRAYVEMLGGNIWVESEEGKGSVFYFTLPYNNEPIAETIDRRHEPSGKNETVRKLKILIAEDDEVSEMLLDEAVKLLGKEILKARTGVQAVETCKNNPDIDLVLMDILMPEMDGYEATKQIREFNKAVIIIAQTAYGLAGDREKAIEAGCNDYIAKPINKSELQALIYKHFRN